MVLWVSVRTGGHHPRRRFCLPLVFPCHRSTRWSPILPVLPREIEVFRVAGRHPRRVRLSRNQRHVGRHCRGLLCHSRFRKHLHWPVLRKRLPVRSQHTRHCSLRGLFLRCHLASVFPAGQGHGGKGFRRVGTRRPWLCYPRWRERSSNWKGRHQHPQICQQLQLSRKFDPQQRRPQTPAVPQGRQWLKLTKNCCGWDI